jgi:hypothetical protein
MSNILTKIDSSRRTKGCDWFLNFLGAPLVYGKINLFLSFNARLDWLEQYYWRPEGAFCLASYWSAGFGPFLNRHQPLLLIGR